MRIAGLVLWIFSTGLVQSSDYSYLPNNQWSLSDDEEINGGSGSGEGSGDFTFEETGQPYEYTYNEYGDDTDNAFGDNTDNLDYKLNEDDSYDDYTEIPDENSDIYEVEEDYSIPENFDKDTPSEYTFPTFPDTEESDTQTPEIPITRIDEPEDESLFNWIKNQDFWGEKYFLAALLSGAIVGFIIITIVVIFICHTVRKADAGSYVIDKDLIQYNSYKYQSGTPENKDKEYFA